MSGSEPRVRILGTTGIGLEALKWALAAVPLVVNVDAPPAAPAIRKAGPPAITLEPRELARKPKRDRYPERPPQGEREKARRRRQMERARSKTHG